MADAQVSPQVLRQIAEAISSIRYGSIQITVQDSRVVRMEKVEKIRLGNEADLTAGGLPIETGSTDRTTGGSPRQDGR
jgi:hypothetical protein